MELNDYFNYFKFQKIENGGENDLLSWLSYELGKIDINGIIKYFDTILEEYISKFGNIPDETTIRIEEGGTGNKKCC